MPLDQELNEDYGEKEMSFLDHLEELRWHIIRSLIAIAIFMVLGFVFVDFVFNQILLAPASKDFATWKGLCALGEAIGKPQLCIDDIKLELQSRYMTGQFTITIVSGLIIGLVMAFPYVAWEMWRFISPGLKRGERKGSRGIVAAISLLFAAGISFGYYVIAPLMVYFMVSYQLSPMIRNEFDITSYVSTLVTLVLGSGLLFQLPVVVYFLSKIGMLTPQFLRKYRKHSIVVLLIIAAIITPPDPLSQTLIFIPLYLLFEVSILISARVQKKRLKAEELERLEEEKARASKS
ncbi:twin-arginine translocase subunit TatC [Pseudochryseolinea flava]|uniref:Sec-independent protein translocase protein TatC n=1 Tax=Pseudochryseolinea flava TaxID=2059302 RepID=A0A364YBG7_9BACT|nr:twin-arginine translocase subunit TatC [Pseudochryseolinea flava]RAW03138.1 twin-arginine translocase subunit TatC [Pseudochryseolinea flava]